MEEGQNYSTFHSEEIQEIMGRKPAWILHWGIMILILIITGIVVGCYFIKYPQIVTAKITLTSENPPSDLVSRYIGFLDSVYVEDGELINTGQLIALVANPSNYNDVHFAEKILSLTTEELLYESAANIASWQNLELGDIQQVWIAFIAECVHYRDYLYIDQIGKRKNLLSSQILRSKEYYRVLEAQRKIIMEELKQEKKALNRDSVLLSRKAIAQVEYDRTYLSYISQKNNLASFDATMVSAQLSRLQLEQQILELDIQHTEEIAEYERILESAKSRVANQIVLWKERYAIIAPISGTVSLQNVWGKGQHVDIGDIIASITPLGGTELIGRMKVSSSGFGKVQRGQEVNVKLNGFPYMEFGILKGLVKSISQVPEKTQNGICYTVNVEFPAGLKSTYHKIIPFVQNMDGSAEIITKDMRLIEQFIRPIRSLFANR
jgi:multidrug resistance efflux pump